MPRHSPLRYGSSVCAIIAAAAVTTPTSRAQPEAARPETQTSASTAERLPRNLLIQDVRRLAEIIESAHPDPYIHGGGKIAFHRRLQNTIAKIPDGGLTSQEFYLLLQPFVAAVGDAHTFLSDPFRYNQFSPGGIPLRFGFVEDILYVHATPQEHKPLIGKRLRAVEDVPFDRIVARQKRVLGTQNDYHLLHHLADRTLWDRNLLEPLIPEWKDKTRIRVTLQGPDGDPEQHVLPVPRFMRYPLKGAPSLIELPSRRQSDFVYQFLDDRKQTALLVIDAMVTHREAFELWRAQGLRELAGNSLNGIARQTYTRYKGAFPPTEEQALIAGLPSATELFRSLVIDMKEAGTRRLIVDIRRNSGGNSMMADILAYFLHGKDKMLSWKLGAAGEEITKYSRLYFDAYPSKTLEQIKAHKPFALRADDYDFGTEFYAAVRGTTRPQEKQRAVAVTLFAKMPTFDALYKSGKYSGYYCPDQVAVLSSPTTFSSALAILNRLRSGGAVVVGTPSGQATSVFGSILDFALANSGLSGCVSCTWYGPGPDEPDSPNDGLVPLPDYPLTYDKLASYHFDPNAELLYALEVLNALETPRKDYTRPP